jgi:hypothetical protein
MFAGISGLFGGLLVDAVPFNILIIASPCGEFTEAVFAVAFLGVAFVAGFLPFVDVVFLVVVANLRFDFGLAMIFSPFGFFYVCLRKHYM